MGKGHSDTRGLVDALAADRAHDGGDDGCHSLAPNRVVYIVSAQRQRQFVECFAAVA